jgi:hypothetical protein
MFVRSEAFRRLFLRDVDNSRFAPVLGTECCYRLVGSRPELYKCRQ